MNFREFLKEDAEAKHLGSMLVKDVIDIIEKNKLLKSTDRDIYDDSVINTVDIYIPKSLFKKHIDSKFAKEVNMLSRRDWEKYVNTPLTKKYRGIKLRNMDKKVYEVTVSDFVPETHSLIVDFRQK